MKFYVIIFIYKYKVELKISLIIFIIYLIIFICLILNFINATIIRYDYKNPIVEYFINNKTYTNIVESITRKIKK